MERLKDAPPTNADVEAGSDSGEELEMTKPRLMLPCFDPHSPSLSSPATKEQAGLKVRLARLKLESQARIQARQAEIQMQQQLEIKKNGD